MENEMMTAHKILVTRGMDEEGYQDGGQVTLDGDVVMVGENSDFYPMCLGITEYGEDWQGINGLVTAMQKLFKLRGDTVTVEYQDARWNYNGELV